GADKIVEFIDWCADLGVPTFTLYMLSTDNMNRSAEELEKLMEIIADTLDRLSQSRPNGGSVRVHPVGQPELLPEALASRLRMLSTDAGHDDAPARGPAAESSSGVVSTATGSIRRITGRAGRPQETPAIHVNVAVGYGGR